MLHYIEALGAFRVVFFLVRAICFTILRQWARFAWCVFSMCALLLYIEAMGAFRVVCVFCGSNLLHYIEALGAFRVVLFLWEQFASLY